MTRIVGARQTYMRSQFFNSSGEARVLQIIQELHATKGWRTRSIRKGKTNDRRTPKFQQEYVLARPAKTYVDPPPITEKALMRHVWYRRKMKKESQLVAAGHVTDAEVF